MDFTQRRLRCQGHESHLCCMGRYIVRTTIGPRRWSSSMRHSDGVGNIPFKKIPSRWGTIAPLSDSTADFAQVSHGPNCPMLCSTARSVFLDLEDERCLRQGRENAIISSLCRLESLDLPGKPATGDLWCVLVLHEGSLCLPRTLEQILASPMREHAPVFRASCDCFSGLDSCQNNECHVSPKSLTNSFRPSNL